MPIDPEAPIFKGDASLILELLRGRSRGQDPAALPEFRRAERELAKLASVAPGSPLRGQMAHPRRARLGLAPLDDADLRGLAGLRAAGLLGDARLRSLVIEWFLTHPLEGGRA